MRRFASLLLLSVALVPAATAKGPAPPYGIEWRLGGGVTLVRLDAKTLAPLKGLRMNLGSSTSPIALSPHGRYLAVSGDSAIRIADLKARRLSRAIYTGGYPVRSSTLWARPNLLLTVADGELLLIDPVKAQELRRIELNGKVVAATRTWKSLVLLVGPDDAIGTLSIAVVDADGNVRSARIDGLRGGERMLEDSAGNPNGMYQELPGLAVDPSGSRAIVVGRTSAAVVDLDRLSSETHSLELRTTQKTIEGWWRGAQWLDATHTAVFGSDHAGEGHNSTPVAVQILDTSAWTARALDTKAGYAIRMGSLLLAADGAIYAYEPNGSLRFRAAQGRTAGQLVAGDTFIYAETTGHGTHWVVLDPANGRIVAQHTFARPMNVVTGL